VSSRNAAKFCIHPDKELKKLLIHGILHLLGFDHETDNGKMRKIQERLVRRIFFRKALPILKEQL
jgi:probable rRNA maturation factor